MPERGNMSIYEKMVGATADGLLPPAVLDGIESDVIQYAATASRGSVEYWVSPSGDDSNAGTEASPWATIARAVASIPDVIREGHSHTITLLPGDWNEQLAVQNKSIQGVLTVQGSTSDRYAHTIRDAYTIGVQGHFVIQNIHSSKTVPGVNFRYHGSGPRMHLSNVSGTGEVTSEPASSGNQGVLADYGSGVLVENSQFDYKDYGVRANYGSTVVARNNTGTGNTHGVGARFGGQLGIYGTVPNGYDGTAAFSSGGIIAHETGGHVGVQRYNAFLDKSDTYGLVDQVTLQGQGNISPIKQWVSRGTTTRQGEITGGGFNIPDGSGIRYHFQMATTQQCNLSIDVTAVWSPVGSTTARAIRTLNNPSVSQSSITAETTRIIVGAVGSGGSGGEGDIVLSHSGADGIFYLDFYPNGGSDNGMYGLDIQISNMMHADAPIMLGVEAIS